MDNQQFNPLYSAPQDGTSEQRVMPTGENPAQGEPTQSEPVQDTQAQGASAQSEPSQGASTQGGQAQNPQAQNPYTAGQTPYGAPQTPPPYGQYGQVPFGQGSYPPPYTPPRPPYGQSPYYSAPPYNPQSYRQPPYGQPPYTQQPYNQQAYNPQPYAQQPYSQQPYYGAPYTQVGYGARAPYSAPVAPDPNFLKKKVETRALRTSSMAHGLAVIGFSVLGFVLSSILVSIPGFSEMVKSNSVFYEAVNAALSVTIIFFPFLFAYQFQKKRGLVERLPLGTPNDSKAAVLLVFIGLLCCVAGSYATGILTTLLETVFGVTFTMPESDMVIDSVPVFLTTVLSTAVVPAFVEEFAIRGAVLQPLRRYGDKFAIVMSALVFALMHGNMVQIPFAFIAGIAIGYAVTVSGSMWVGVAIHFLNNLMSVLMQTAVDNLSNTQENIAILAILAVIFTAGIVCLLLYFKFYARTPLQKGNTLLQNGEKTKAYICTVPMIIAIILLLIETMQYIEF